MTLNAYQSTGKSGLIFERKEKKKKKKKKPLFDCNFQISGIYYLKKKERDIVLCSFSELPWEILCSS